MASSGGTPQAQAAIVAECPGVTAPGSRLIGGVLLKEYLLFNRSTVGTRFQPSELPLPSKYSSAVVVVLSDRSGEALASGPQLRFFNEGYTW
jgi:hypothetical protein